MVNDIYRAIKQYAELEPEVILNKEQKLVDSPIVQEFVEESNEQITVKNPNTVAVVSSEIITLEVLEKQVAKCFECELHKGRTNTVFGEGNPNADLMFVGEGPGAEEDKQGLPFVGRAGSLLTDIIKAMGYSREEVYIANIVKCRPPSNRVPAEVEARTCLPFLKKQIDLIAPKVIVALGATAATYLLNLSHGTTIKSLRENVHDYNNIPVYVTYHPAALLRNPEYKRPTWEDMKLVMQFLKK